MTFNRILLPSTTSTSSSMIRQKEILERTDSFMNSKNLPTGQFSSYLLLRPTPFPLEHKRVWPPILAPGFSGFRRFNGSHSVTPGLHLTPPSCIFRSFFFCTSPASTSTQSFQMLTVRQLLFLYFPYTITCMPHHHP